MTTYLVRHYIFTFAVLRKPNHRNKNDPITLVYEPTVSILIPAHNEEHVIKPLLQRLAELTYPVEKLQVIVVDDASSDRTGETIEEFAAHNKFIQILTRDKKVGGRGKAAALNAGLKIATGEIVVCFDADYLPQSDILQKLTRGFADPKIGAVQGRPVVLNESKNGVTRLVTLERIGGYRVDQEARNSLNLIPQFGGTVGGFRRNLIEFLGGFDEAMLTEDTDLTFQIILQGNKIAYDGEAECYEEAVSSWRAYWRQRHRWAEGHMQVCLKHELNVLRSDKLGWKEKLDGLLLLNIYFMPVLTLFALVLGILLIIYEPSPMVYSLWFFVPISLYSTVGNFAPFFEVGVGVYLDGRRRLQWLIPLLIFLYLLNIAICTKAFLDLCGSKIHRPKSVDWEKTQHLGDGNRYIANQSYRLKDRNGS